MKKTLICLFVFCKAVFAFAQDLPTRNEIITSMKLVNDYWIDAHADAGNNQWARAAYFTGNMDFYKLYPKEQYIDYINGWAEANQWALNGGVRTRHADNHCVGQIYFDLYAMDQDKDFAKIEAIAQSIERMVTAEKADDWWWVDALYMAMPVFTRLGYLTGDEAYYDKMYQLYTDTKVARGLYNNEAGLWYRDESFAPPYTTPNGLDSYWSRGNGWVFGAHVRVLQLLPDDNKNRSEYIATFQEMAEALKACQREDGFWNVSLADANDFGGPETSGTAFFAYGMAWGINNGLLDSATYYPSVVKAWDALALTAVQANGFLAYVQGVGSNPASSQPVTVNSTADFGVGAFLLAGTEVVKMAAGEMPVPSIFYIDSLNVISNTAVDVFFSKELETVSALKSENYAIEGVDVLDVELTTANSVKLVLNDLGYGSYTLLVENLKSSSGLIVEVGEAEVFSYSGVKSVTASSYESGSSNTPENTLDVNLGTRWSAEGDGQWIRYDLGAVRLVQSVDMAFFNGDQRSALFNIYLSGANGDSVLVYEGKSSGETVELENFDFDDQSARYVTIVGFGNSSSAWNSITETRINYDYISGVNAKLVSEISDLNIYPNPLQGTSIKVSGVTGGNVQVCLSDMSGRPVYESADMPVVDGEMEICNLTLSVGIYIVIVIDSSGKRAAVLSVY